ncbi:CHAT domain-containing protein [Micromonospora sp. WMMD1082]|uniref:CHAT domain-containing protein n=1 Tax=Micromonospora sp. WMMD1082 TaxID=3016104 RepID=UPI00241639A1|nr:CHAT domain-containing protein [Micromonospora sp. WMMD1082]MDG4798152.1 CHAT domain-containing protein [Micromonospora sp. WMMD1082]
MAPPRAPAARSLAESALELVGRDPRAALALADAAAAAARRERDPGAGSTAHRAAGLALRELPDLAGAERRLRAAVTAGDRGGDEQAAALARMSLALVLLDRGRIRAALSAADRAAGVLRGLPAARLKSQRALILQRAGRLDEALAAFAEALPVLRRSGDALWEARALNNRGLLYGYRGALAAAEADLERARGLHAALGLAKFAADVDWNRGFVAGRRGDVPAALARFDAAEKALVGSGAVHPQLYVDRAEVLLGVGLAEQARDVLRRTITILRSGGQDADLAEGLVLLARAALDAGDPAEAATVARQARTRFARQGRAGWALQAGVIELRAAELAGAPAAGLLRTALARATALAAVGWRAAELDARLTAAAAATRLGRAELADDQLARASAARRAASLDVRTRAWYASAMRQVADGNRGRALAALRAGLTAVERRQAAVGATEFRVHVAAHGVRLAQLGLSLAIDGGDPRAVLRWAERVRARSLRLPPARPPADEELAAALAELRRLSAALLAAQLDGKESGGLALRQRAAEERVVRASRTAPGAWPAPVGPGPAPATLRAELGDAVLVEYVQHDGELLAVTLGPRGCRLHRLGPAAPVGSAVQEAHFGLRRLALGFGTSRGADQVRRATAAAAGALDAALVAPLAAVVADRPVVIVPTGALHAVPWGLLPDLAARPVRVAPSAAAWLRAATRPVPHPAGPVVLAAGPGLPAAHTEVVGVGRTYDRARVLVGDEASAAAVTSALDGAGLAHLAAHGRLRTDNPLFSALDFADGPLTVYDLERLGRAPRLVVLPACQSGTSAVRAGDELMGLATALLALGTRTVVAAVAPVHDVATSDLMESLHRRLRAGVPPESAVAAARAEVGPTGPAAWAAAASFSVFGA